MTPHSKPHKWIAHFLHVFTKYQWVNTAQGATDRELQSINCCCSSSRGRLSPQKQVELFGIFNPDEDHKPACDKKGWHKQTKKSHWQLEKSKKKTRLLVVLNSAIEAKNLEMENKKKYARKRSCYDSRFQKSLSQKARSPLMERNAIQGDRGGL